MSFHQGEGGHTSFSEDPDGVSICVSIGVTILVGTISLELVLGIPPNLHGYIFGSSLRAD